MPLAKNKTPGMPIVAKEWNDAMDEIDGRVSKSGDTITGDVTVNNANVTIEGGQIWADNLKREVERTGPTTTKSAKFTAINGMTVDFTLKKMRTMWIFLNLPGVTTNGSAQFQLKVDPDPTKDEDPEAVVAFTEQSWSPGGDRRSVILTRFLVLDEGPHKVVAEWRAPQGNMVTACASGHAAEHRTLQIIEFA